jgi:RND family efflux transporter MFP subunit
MSIASETLRVKEDFAKTGSFSGPPLESKKEAFSVAEAELTGAEENLKIAEANREAACVALKKIFAISSTGEFARRPLDEAKGQFAQAESEYLQAKNQLTRAETELHRSEKLYEEGLISGKELLLVQTDYRNATVHLSQTEAQMEVAKGILEREQTIYDSGVRNDTELQDGKTKYIQAEKEYARAEAELKKARSNLEIMKSQMTREENIYSKDLNTRQELEQASSAYREAKVEYEKSVSVLKTFGISPEDASKYSGGDFPVISPIKGYVSERHLNTGEVIAVDTVIFKILDSSTLWIDSEVYERDAGKVKIGQTVQIITSAYPDKLFRGKIFYISDTLKQDTRTFNVRVSFDNRKYLLKPGMTVTSRINTDTITGFILPPEAVMDEKGTHVIFLSVKGKENVFAKREVKAEALKNGAYIINSGLSAGEEVVTTGAFLIKSEENKGNLQG